MSSAMKLPISGVKCEMCVPRVLSTDAATAVLLLLLHYARCLYLR